MESLYFENEQKYTTTIVPTEICNNITNILTKKIKDDVEGKCVSEGYIKKDSIKIIKRSIGRLMDIQFNGNVIYEIIYTASVCNPSEGMVLKCYVENINKMGIMAYIKDEDSPLNILLAKQHHQNNEFFSGLKENDEIYVSVLGKRFEFNDTKISVIAKLIEKPDDSNKTEIETKGVSSKEESSKEESSEKTQLIYTNKDKNYKWLSNYNISNPFTYKDRKYISLEHAFNAQKNEDDDFKDLFTQGKETYIGDLPNLAKKTGNKTNMKKMKKSFIKEWDKKQLEIMEDILRVYYDSNPDLKQKLINTGSNILIYKGVGVDSFWGVDKNDKGENNHGKILMKLREEFSSK